MAGNSRQVEFDVLLTGVERSERKLDDLGDAFDEVRRAVKRLDGTNAKTSVTTKKVTKDTGSLTDRLGDFAVASLSAGRSVLRFASVLGVAAGAAGPVALGVVAATAAVAQFAAEVSGAAAAVAPLAAGLVFLKLTFKGMGAEFERSVEPITEGWKRQTAAAGRLATRGLKPLSREFARVNLPVIARAQERIARSTNRVVTGFGKWVNSARGTRVIARITGDTATAFERLAPAARGVVQSFVEMAGRVSGTSFATFTDAAETALDRLNGFIDRVGADDVQRGFDRLRDGAGAVVGAFQALGDAVAWLEENRQRVLAFSDALLVLGGVGGALVGGPAGWLTALGAGLVLLARHWDTVTGAVTNTLTRLREIPQRFASIGSTLDAARGAWDRITEGASNFAAVVGPKLAPALDRIETAFIKLQPFIRGNIVIFGQLAKAGLTAAGILAGGLIDGIGLAASALGNLATAAQITTAAILGAFADLLQPIATLAKKLHLPFAGALQDMVDGARGAKDRINNSMDEVDTDLARREITQLQDKIRSLQGKKVKTEADRAAIADSQRRIRELQGTINGLRGRTVTTTVITRNIAEYQTYRSGERNARAVGGPVEAGKPYVVGDRGRPELFVPKQAGRIMPRVPSGWNPGGGGTTVIVTLNAPNYVGPQDEFVRAIRGAVKHLGGGNVQRAFGR